jgi:hypothetical protein
MGIAFGSAINGERTQTVGTFVELGIAGEYDSLALEHFRWNRPMGFTLGGLTELSAWIQIAFTRCFGMSDLSTLAWCLPLMAGSQLTTCSS